MFKHFTYALLIQEVEICEYISNFIEVPYTQHVMRVYVAALLNRRFGFWPFHITKVYRANDIYFYQRICQHSMYVDSKASYTQSYAELLGTSLSNSFPMKTNHCHIKYDRDDFNGEWSSSESLGKSLKYNRIKEAEDEKNDYRQSWAGHVTPTQLHPHCSSTG